MSGLFIVLEENAHRKRCPFPDMHVLRLEERDVLQAQPALLVHVAA